MALLPCGVRLSSRRVFPLPPIITLGRKSSSYYARIHGLGNRDNLASELLNCCTTISGLSESRCAFDRIVNQDISFWNLAIVRCFRAGDFEKVLWLYTNLKSRGISVDSLSITFSLKSCSELEDVEFGRRIQVDAYKLGLNGGRFVGSSLIGFYSRYANIEDAHRAFQEIVDKDVVAYTSMVTGYARFSDSNAQKAFEIAREMMAGGLGVNRVTLVSLLHASGRLEALKVGRSIHCYAFRRGIDLSDEAFETSLVDMYTRCGAVTLASSMLRQLERGNVASWNAVISVLVARGQTCEALKFFHLMVQDVNLSPDSITIANVLAACSDLDYVTTIHCYLIRREISLDLVVITVLIDIYSKFERINYARTLFVLLMTKDLVLYNVMISGYVQNGKVDEAIQMFHDMTEEGVQPNSATVLSLLSAFAELSDVRKGSWIHGLVLRFCLESDINVLNQILHMYAKCGCIEMARKIFNSMKEKDLASWTAMMMGHVDTGRPDEALALFQLMQGERVRPDPMALTTALHAISQLGSFNRAKEIHGFIYRVRFATHLDTIEPLIIAYAKCGRLDTARNIFNAMLERGSASWNTMMTAYSIHGHCREAMDVFDQMRRENVNPNAMTFASLLSACSHSGLVEEGWRVFRSMRSEYSIDPQDEHYSCMVDLLGRAGQLEEAYDFLMSSPMRNRSNALCALLAACRNQGNTVIGEAIGGQLLNLESGNSRAYTMVSSLYAQASKWSESARLRDLAGERGLIKMSGYSLIESEEIAIDGM